MSLSLWIPPSARGRRLRCAMPGCGKEWPEYQRREYIRHVTQHSNRDYEHFEEQDYLRESNAFTGVLDNERYEWEQDRKRAAA